LAVFMEALMALTVDLVQTASDRGADSMKVEDFPLGYRQLRA